MRVIKKIDHVGIVVSNIDETLKLLSDIFGFGESDTFMDSGQAFRSSLIRINDATFELIEPIGTQGSIAKFLKERGNGLHHVSLEVDDLAEELKSLQKMGIRLINTEPQPVGDSKVLFIHPHSTKGVLIELVQKGG
jgi:methylmalonyl-CoA/ethylmalonyl-CoA epimerase